MILLGLSLAPLLALANSGGMLVTEQPQAQEADSEDKREPAVRRVVIRNQLIIRVPVRPKRATSSYRLTSGPRCLNSEEIIGARLAGARSIDFLLEGQQVMRMTTDRACPSLDFYGGFYVQPNDELLCARRDEIRTRMGSSCRIERFQRLRPAESGQE